MMASLLTWLDDEMPIARSSNTRTFIVRVNIVEQQSTSNAVGRRNATVHSNSQKHNTIAEWQSLKLQSQFVIPKQRVDCHTCFVWLISKRTHYDNLPDEDTFAIKSLN